MSQAGLFSSGGSSGANIQTITPDAGTVVVPTLNNVNAFGGSNINTFGAGSTLTINLNETIVWPASSSTQSFIQVGTDIVFQVYGIDNIFAGPGAGNLTLTGSADTGIGAVALTSLTTGSDNTAVGADSLMTLTSGDNNTAVGSLSLELLDTGANNIAIGYLAGSAYTGAESSNILIGNAGTLADANTIRIGTNGSGSGQQDTTFIAGIAGVTVSNTEFVTIDSVTGQLGSSSGSGTGFVLELDGDTGTATPTLGAITIAGGTNIATSATASTLTVNFDGTLPVGSGGTGTTSLTDHGVLLGSGTSAVTVTSVGTDGQLLIGATGADPAFASLTSIGGTITITPGANSLNIEAVGGGGGASSFPTDSGTATESAGSLTIAGGSNINTSGSGSTVTVNLDDKIAWPAASSTASYISINTLTFMSGYAGNTFLGYSAGNFTVSGSTNTGIGLLALSSLTSGEYNTIVGNNSGNALADGSENIGIGSFVLVNSVSDTQNIAIGDSSLTVLNGGSFNTAIGYSSLDSLTAGNYNTVIGYISGENYTSSESSNILLMNSGVIGESNVMRLGTQGTGDGQVDTTYIAGIAGVSVSNLEYVTIDSVTGQLGSAAGSGTGFVLELDGDTGTATPTLGAITIAGGSNINTSATGSTVTVNLDSTVSISGSMTAGTGLTATTGNITATAGNIALPTTSSTAGQVLVSSNPSIHFYGSNQAFIGYPSGNFTMSGSSNTGIGAFTLTGLTSGSSNSAFGIAALRFMQSGSFNVCFGESTMATSTSGSGNNVFGFQAAYSMTGSYNVVHGFQSTLNLTTGSYNITMGYQAGNAYTSSESSNILIQNAGSVGESHKMRLGTDGTGNGQVDTCYIAGNVNAISATSGATRTLTVGNSSNTASSAATIIASTAGSTAGDATYQATTTTTTWSFGVDNSVTTPTADPFVISQGSTLGTNNIMSVATSGEINYPLQPAFMAFLATNDTNVTGNGTTYTLGTNVALTEVFDQNSDFNTNGTFTAPVTGRYMLSAQILVYGCTVATNFNLSIATSNRNYVNQFIRAASANNQELTISFLCDMDAADTAVVKIQVSGEAADTCDLYGGGTDVYCGFSGYLVA